MLTTTIADFPVWVFTLLLLAGFAAGYIDAIAGGGGMIQTLALLMAGVPPLGTLATNKIVSMTGTVTAVLKYARERVINWHLALACIIPCMLAAYVGSKLVMFLDEKLITWLIIGCIPIAFITMSIKQKHIVNTNESSDRRKAIALLSPIAFYDGLLGPGTGTYMAITANKGLNMRFLRATGLAKPLNLSTNFGSAIAYIFAGKVLWFIAIPMAIASALGAYLGSHSAVVRGDGFIKQVMLVMLVIMLIANVIKLIV